MNGTPPVARILSRDWGALNAALPLTGKGVAITRLMHMIWLIRRDLQAMFPLETEAGRLGLARWLVTDGRREYGLGDWLVPSYAIVTAPDTAPPTLSRAIWARRADLQAEFPLDRWRGRRRYLAWLRHHGRQEYGLSRRAILDELRRAGATDMALAMLVRHALAELRSGGGRLVREIRRFVSPRPPAAAPLACPPAGYDGPARPDPGSLPWSDSPSLGGTPIRRAAWRPAGINLIGYARGELGVGEDVRCAAHALGGRDVPLGIVNISRGLGARQGDRSADRYLAPDPRYRASLFCVTAIEMINVFLELGPDAFDRRYNIGYWPWELSRWPDQAMPAFTFVDEVWAASRFTAEALAARSPVPVRHMPPAVVLPERRDYGRRHFGLPEGSFLFVLTLDFHSFLQRKNPFATIAAFRRAFPGTERDAGLVIKAMNVRDDDPDWRRLTALADEDPRISLITGTMSRAEVIGLVAECDCYLSLHRAEGFGRGPAEAMALGKPVIVTDYSGTRDFCRPDTAFPVGCRMVEVGAEAYLFPQGQVWAEPDIDEAAAHMRQLARDPGLGRAVGEVARHYMETHHGLATVGRAYAARLAELGLI